jgi:hypothetical protein
MPYTRRNLPSQGIWPASALLAVVLLMGCSIVQTVTVPQGTATAQATTTVQATHTTVPPTPTGSQIIYCPSCVLGASVHEVAQQQTLTGSNGGVVTATCPSGQVALAGGWAMPSSGVAVLSSNRLGAGSWTVQFQQSSTATVTAYAECLAGVTGATVAERSAVGGLNVLDSPPQGVKGVACNAGEVLVGGGFALVATSEVQVASFATGTAWNAYVYGDNNSYSGEPFTIYAECLTYSAVHVLAVDEFTPVANGTASATCPSGTFVSGGGYLSGGPFLPHGWPIYSVHAGGNGWRVTDSGPNTFSAEAECVTLA